MYNRIRELSKAATRGWPGKRVHTRWGSLQPSVGLQENVSQEMLCKKKEGKAYLIIIMLFAMIFAMLFAAIVNHIGVCIMIFAMLFVMLFALYGKSSIKLFYGS